ncbi:uncharacterized protein LOC124828174 [Vigna umbellata]|uniref:Uncharacterized protein n=3 Tax=Vigna TaxID=3913 RepID=A0A8T0JQN6_PHAAN|nr:uncharacterized protein LOC124828174 [Vigna umbellata]KAG2380492.1 uncharacterized protein HKW66_Vig0172710 [Vigna angularis]BAT97770.1 hypothetical protein VIGAN_09131100 [Vigna angularis var. angularis]
MNSNKREEEDDLFLPHPSDLSPPPPPLTDPSSSSFSLLFPSSPSSSHSSPSPPSKPLFISPDPHISSQFYTFTPSSHALMLRSLLLRRLPSPSDIRGATPRNVLASWRTVWKDRNEDTAYLTAWKRIQDKLTTHHDPSTNSHFLCFKTNPHQFVPHVEQWQQIVMSHHADTDLNHLNLKDTLERIKQHWTVGAKFYGIPESFIRVCVAACPACCAAEGSAEPSASRGKRRRFEYTESFDVPAREVPSRLQQLAAKHKVVLCIRQKYIRYKPFMAEVKDYACHRAGEPAAKKSKVLKREPYASKRCGCGFRIRAIVPIANYNEKDKSFVYQEEGVAVFKLYAVHSGHEPGPLDGNARIMHRVVGHKGGGYLMDQENVYGVSEEMDGEGGFGLLGKEDGGDLQFSVLQQVQELRNEVGMLEGKVAKMPRDLLGSISRELYEVLNKVRSIGEVGLKPAELITDKVDDVLVGDNDLANWSNHHERIYGDGKDTELIEDDEDSFGRTLGEVVSWGDQMRTECRSEKDLMSDSCKPEKWLKCSDFDEKSILDCEEDSKLSKPIRMIRHDEGIVSDVVGLGCIQVDSFYQDNSKWYDSPCALDTGADCGDSGFRHGEIL